MTEKEFIQFFARTLAHACYRNGYIEDLHSDRTKNLYDSDMKELNKDIYNRIYTVCLALFATNEDKMVGEAIFDSIFRFNSLFGGDWDEPKICEDMVYPESALSLLKKIEKNLDKIQHQTKEMRWK